MNEVQPISAGLWLVFATALGGMLGFGVGVHWPIRPILKSFGKGYDKGFKLGYKLGWKSCIKVTHGTFENALRAVRMIDVEAMAEQASHCAQGESTQEESNEHGAS
jgi:hypothetical protein